MTALAPFKPAPQLSYPIKNGNPYAAASASGAANTDKQMSLLATTKGGKRIKRIKGGNVVAPVVAPEPVIATPIKPMFAQTGPNDVSTMATNGQQHSYNQHAAGQFDNCSNGSCPPTVTKVGGSRRKSRKSRRSRKNKKSKKSRRSRRSRKRKL